MSKGIKEQRWKLNSATSSNTNVFLSITPSYQPEILRAQHLGVVHDFTLVRGDLQGGQHVVHPGQVGG